MDEFARIIVGYHGCTEDFARELLLGTKPIDQWQPSTNEWDWLGHGIHFWEHSRERALRWAKQKYANRSETPSVLGAVIQLGRCFDLHNESITGSLTRHHKELAEEYARSGQELPTNSGKDHKRRELDCLVLNGYFSRLQYQDIVHDAVRGAFLEGEPAYAGAGFSREAHIQVAVRNPSCILGVFRPR